MVFSTNEAVPGGSMHASSGKDGDYDQSPAFGSACSFAALAATGEDMCGAWHSKLCRASSLTLSFSLPLE
uniref:Uncharacterized protein n=1 Tax=Leersia perrieri TaxID=77586 RepID=A0A0D9VZY9_9ORYZ